MNNKIGQVLKNYRKLNGLSVSDVSRKLNENYGLKIAEKTVYGWESNQAHPTADTFLIICEMYGITDISSMLEHPAAQVLTDMTSEEHEIITAYRKFPAFQPAIRYLLHLPQKKSR